MDIGTFNFGLAGVGLAVVYGLGFLSAVDAVMKTRTPQGTTAWVFALATVPLEQNSSGRFQLSSST